jgi:oligoendopeptidase F
MDDLQAHDSYTDSPAALADGLKTIEEILAAKSRLELYAKLRRNEDTTADGRRDRHQRSQRLAADVDEAVQAVQRRIHRNASSVRNHTDDPALNGWRDYLDNLLAQAPHTRDAGTEEVIAAFKPVVKKQADTVIAITTDDFEPPTVEDSNGDPFEVDRRSYSEALDSPDRSFRRRAHEAFFDALEQHKHALAATIVEKAQAYAALAEARNYDSVREMAFSRASYPDTGMYVSFPESAHNAVVENVRDHLDAYHDLLESRRECLGVEPLQSWDVNAPLVEGDAPDLSFAEVREHVLAAVQPLGEDYRDRLAVFLNERRMDIYPTQKKRTDIPAYCPSNPETGAFILANFREDLRTVFFLAHELGHAMHIEYLRDAQPPRYVNSPQPISEVPSLVHELLLTDHLLDEGNSSLAPFVRERRAEFLSGNVYGAGQSAAFLHDVYRTVENGGDLTPERLAGTYADYATEFRDAIEAEDAGVGWQRQNYARKPYHYYQYVTGTVAAVSVYQRIRSGDLTAEAYRDFLRNTGRRDSGSSFESLDIDVTASNPYERVADELDHIRAARPN